MCKLLGEEWGKKTDEGVRYHNQTLGLMCAKRVLIEHDEGSASVIYQ